MTAVVLRVELTEQPIELSEYEALVAHESAGAVVGFTIYIATDKLETSKALSPDPEVVEAAGAA